jgi:hypothetical protein
MATLRNKGPFAGVGLDNPTSEEIFTPEEGELERFQQARRARLGDFELGLQSGALGVQAGSAFRRADKAEAKGDLALAEKLRAQAGRLQETGAEFSPRISSSADVESVSDAIDFAQAGFGQLAPTMAATSVPGIIGGIAGGLLTFGNPIGVAAGAGIAAGFTGFEMEAGEAASEQQADEAIRALPVAERLREQNIKGAQAAALELVFPTMVGGRLAGSVAKIFKKLETAEDIARAAKDAQKLRKVGRVSTAEAGVEEGSGAAVSVFKETASEAATEASQTLVGQASLNRLNPLRDRSHDVQELIDSTILGALGGGGMSLSTTVPGALAKKVLGSTSAEVDAEGNIKPGAGQRIRDALITATGGVVDRAARIKDSDIVRGAKAKIKDSKLGDKIKDSDVPLIVKNVAKAAKTKVDEIGKRISQAEIDRRARLRKSAFSPAARSVLEDADEQRKLDQEAAAATEDFIKSTRFETSAEEVTGLREVGPIAKEETKGQRRFVRLQKADVDSHLQDLVTRGVLTQEVADSAKVEPLGTNLSRKGASVEEMENTLASIVRDLLTRIEGNRKKGGNKTAVADRNKALESELANLPLDVSKRGETTARNEAQVDPTIETRQAFKRKTGTKGQAELFPEDVGQTFPVEIKEFRKNHFGLSVDIAEQTPVQGELGLGKVNRKQLLVQALNNYGQILASDATAEAAPATVAQHKANRSRYEQASRAEKTQMESEGKVIRLKKKNGQTEIVDAESVIQTALAEDREGIVGNIRGKAKQDQAALLAGLAKEILRNDIDGVIDPQTGKVATGSRQQDLLGAYVEGTPALSAKTRGKEALASAGQDTAVTGKRARKGLKKGDIRRVIAGTKRSEIQKGYNAARKEHLELTGDDIVARAKVLKGAAQKQRKVLADLKKFNEDYAKNKEVAPPGMRLSPQDLAANKELIATLTAKYGKDVGDLFGNRQRAGTAEMRADRLESLVEELNELRAEEKAAATQETGEIRLKGLKGEKRTKIRAETGELAIEAAQEAAESGVRHAEEQTGAGAQTRVGQPLRGAGKQKKVPKSAAARIKQQQEDLATRLAKVESVQAARLLIAKVLGFKSVAPGLFDITAPVVLLGNLAKGVTRAVAAEAGVPVKGTVEVVAGERVTVLIAEADIARTLESREFGQLVASGAEIVMPVTSGPLRAAMAENGYKAQRIGGVEVWVQALGEADVSSRNETFVSTESRLDPLENALVTEAVLSASHHRPSEKLMQTWYDFAHTMLAEGAAFKDIIHDLKVKVAQPTTQPTVKQAISDAIFKLENEHRSGKIALVDKHQQLHNKNYVQALKQLVDGAHFDDVISDLENRANGPTASATLERALNSVIERLVAERDAALKKTVEAAEALGDEAGQAVIARAKIKSILTLDGMFERLRNQAGLGAFNNEKAAKSWIEFNYDDLVEMYVRRWLLSDNPLMARDEAFASDRAAQVRFLQKTFGKRVAKRIGIAVDSDAALSDLFDITFQGEIVDLSKFKGQPGALAVLAFLRKMAPHRGPTLVAAAYFRELSLRSREIMRFLKVGNGEVVFQSYENGQVDSATGMQVPEFVTGQRWIARGKDGKPDLAKRDAFIERVFGAQHKGKTAEELMDVPLRVGDSTAAVQRHVNKLRDAEMAFSRGVMVKEVPRHIAFGKNMTLRQAIEGRQFTEDSLADIDVEFTGNLERLTAANNDIAEGGGHMGSYNPLDDRVTLYDGALKNKFQAAWTAWHELYHRGVAVEHGAEVETMMRKAGENPTVKAIAAQMRLERTMIGDTAGRTELGAIEEALVELGAAIEMGDFAHIEQQYGVKVSENLKRPLADLWTEFKAVMTKVMKALLLFDPKFQELKSDIDILEILKGVRETTLSAGTVREIAAESLRPKGFDPSVIRFSKQVTGVEKLTDEVREQRRVQTRDWLAKVLGDEIADKFRDVLSADTDAAGSFDWKTTVIEIAIDSVGWNATAAHEAFHAFFNKMAKIDSAKQVYNRLLKAANAPHIKRQLRALLKDNPAALEQLADPEERLAYMFQFYATGQINLQPQTMKTFRKWARKLGELVGLVSRHESAQRIFDNFLAGDLRTNFQIRDMLVEEQSTGLAAAIGAALRPVNEGLRAVLTSATDRLRNTNNVSLTRIANLFAPEVKAGGEAGYIASKARVEAQFRNGFDEILERHAVKGEDSKSALKREREALSILQGQLDAEEGSLASDLRLYLADMFEYLRDEDNDIFNDDGTLQEVSPNAVHQLISIKDGVKNWEVIRNEGGRYFPRAWDIATILNNWTEFKKIMEEEGGLTGEALSNFKHALEQSDGMVEIDLNQAEFDAAMRAVNSRTFEFITQDNAHRFSKFQEQDLTNILTKYARQAANRGEQTRHFGKDNEKITKLLKEAKQEGASKDDIKMAEKAIKALEGTLGVEAMSPLKKNLMMTAMTAVNFAVLPLALFSSLVDPLGVLVRTGSLPAAAKTFGAGVTQILADIRGNKSQHQKFAEFMGIVEQEQMLAVTGDAYNSMFQNETLRKLNARFFKIIGLDSWTKGTRIGAMVAGMLYMRDIAADGNTRAMEELGLQEGDIQMSKTQPDYVETSAAVLGRDKARRVQAAIFRMVDESILRPSAAQRPIFMSDIRFMLLGHLKQFTFSFHNTIVKQVALNINNKLDNQDYIGAMQQLAPLLAYVPMMIAADMLRAAVGGRLDDDDDEFNLASTVFEGVQRSAILGVNTFALDAGEEVFGFNSLPISTFLGPVISKGTKLVESGVDPDQSFNKAAVKMLPGYAFWKGWMK